MTLNIDQKCNYKWPIKQSNQIARAFESATDKRIVIRVYIRIFIVFTMSVRHLVKFLGIIWGKLRKNKRKYLFYFKTLLLFFLHHREKVGWLKAIDTANFERVNKVKLHMIQIKFQRNDGCDIYPKKLSFSLISA